MAKPKPIETFYNGYRFRSRLEARWAVVFDNLGIKYEYEKEGYDLGPLGYYLPDFWIPEHRYFIEVKGNPYDDEGIAKAEYLDDNPPDGVRGCVIFSQLEIDCPHDERFGMLQSLSGKSSAAIYRALAAGRQARFEHGEVPNAKRTRKIH